MVGTYAGLGGAQARPTMNQGCLLLVPSLVPLSERFVDCQGHILLIWETLGKSKTWAKTDCYYGKPTGNSLDGPEHRSGAWRYPQGKANSGRQVDRDSDIAPACQLCQGKGSEKEQWFLPARLSEKKLPLQLLPWCETIQFLPYALDFFYAAAQHWSLEGGSPCKSV